MIWICSDFQQLSGDIWKAPAEFQCKAQGRPMSLGRGRVSSYDRSRMVKVYCQTQDKLGAVCLKKIKAIWRVQIAEKKMHEHCFQRLLNERNVSIINCFQSPALVCQQHSLVQDICFNQVAITAYSIFTFVGLFTTAKGF